VILPDLVGAIFVGPYRNQHIIKSTFPTAYWYVSPSDEHFSQFPRFVSQFECKQLSSFDLSLVTQGHSGNGTIDVIPYLTVDAGTSSIFIQ
jgi:hercynylcysteine S-oxide lyase